MRETPKPYERYRHFKGREYQVLTLAKDSEDGTSMVVYQALYGEYQVYVRTLRSFMSPVDREKYPNADQANRFERISPLAHSDEVKQQEQGNLTEAVMEAEKKVMRNEDSQQPDLDPLVLAYLDAYSVEERLNILAGAHHRITDEMIDVMAACSDFEVEEGPVEQRYQSLRTCLMTKQKFEKARML